MLSRARVLGVLLLGVAFHATYMYSVIDIYFRSPLVHSTRHYSLDNLIPSLNRENPPADRIVFIVADGLRADTFFEINGTGKSNAPFLRSVIQNDGSWGVQHTRMPTESRPCHVAMFAGFYEDVSAITTGWKENVVEFDSVFNQSNYVLQIGSPDVVRIFRSNHIDSLYYPPEMEDFSGDASNVDAWVFEHLERILSKDIANRTEKEEEIRNKLLNHKDRVFIFLHLLGMDTAGHAFKPDKQGYRDTLHYVDRGVEKMINMINEFFNNDNRTAFIFTADHGMSSRGAHGDGNPECTRTPLVAWGSGIRKSSETIGRRIISDGLWTDPQVERKMIAKDWKLDPMLRKDIEQADMTPLLASLLGIPYPANNIGKLPVGYLSGDDRFMALNLYLNARQILEQFHTKEQLKRERTPFFFVPYGPPISKGFNESQNFLDNIEKLINKGEYEKAQEQSIKLINISMKGLDYYQTYDWSFLMTTIIAGYLGWTAYLLTYALKNYTSVKVSYKPKIALWDTFTILFSILLVGFLYVQNAPLTYYIYVAFPIYFYNCIFKDLPLIIHFISSVDKLDTIMRIILYLIGLEAMVYGYFHREIFSVCFLLIGIMPVFIEWSFQNRFGWLASCIFASLFTLIDVNIRSNTSWVITGGVWIIIKQIIWNKYTENLRSRGQMALFYTQLLLIAAATYLVHSTDTSIANKTGLPLLNQYASILITIISLLLPFLSSTEYKVRVQSFFMAFATPLILLSVAYEVLFFSSLEMFIYMWLKREVKTRENYKRAINGAEVGQTLVGQDFTTAMFYIFLFNVGFFGTGNLASIASFELQSVYRFVTVFAPFLMTGLLLFKIISPLLAVTAAFGTILRVTNTPQFGAFFIVLAMFNIMTINFFFLVQTVGSWMDIGNSISRFGIGNAMIIILLILISVSQLYTWNITSHENDKKKVKKS